MRLHMNILCASHRPTPFPFPVLFDCWLGRADTGERRVQAGASDAAAGKWVVSGPICAWRVGDRDTPRGAPTCGRVAGGALMIKCCGAHAVEVRTGRILETRLRGVWRQIKGKEREIAQLQSKLRREKPVLI